VLGALEDLAGGRIERVHMVGGGVRNRQICQATADACGRAVIAGPVEATALGNVLMQAIATGALGSIAEARELIRRSQAVEHYEPRDADRWSAAYERFRTVCGL
jgi:rhamnulokinase